MSITQPVFDIFSDHLETVSQSLDLLSPLIEQTSEVMVQSLLSDKKMLVCGGGTSSALAQHFATTLLNRFEYERPALPAFSLNADSTSINAISSDCGSSEIFSRQISALGQEQDILLTISAGGSSASLIQAIQVAHDRGMTVIALDGEDDQDFASLMLPNDIELQVRSSDPARIHEVHLLILHCLGKLIDQQLFGNGE